MSQEAPVIALILSHRDDAKRLVYGTKVCNNLRRLE